MGCSSAKMILLTSLLGWIELPPPLNGLLAEKVKFLPEQFGTRPNGPKKWRHPILRTRLFLLLDIRKIPISMLKLSTQNLVFWSPGNSYRFPIWLTLFSMLRPGGGFLSGPTLCPLACSAGPPLISPVTTARPPPPSLPRAAPLEHWRVALKYGFQKREIWFSESEKYMFHNYILSYAPPLLLAGEFHF